MSFTKSALTLSISAVISTSIWAEDQTNTEKNPQQLETITVVGHP